ncbi:MAG: cytochrome c biogenesis protein CcsA [Rickettsiaceae bacterium H1]|nr:cytochrome c biogenesis protein CcsA [Rickettsiaceae bacterium H1]
MENFSIIHFIKNLFIKNSFHTLFFLFVITVLTFAFGLYQAIWQSPADYLQGDAVRIMYVHVPAAWIGLGIYFVMAIGNFISIAYRSKLPEIFAYALAPIGACFTFICLITGSIWGKPIWGAWWIWDARLTSMLILFFFYIGYIMLWDHELKFSKAAAVFNIIGAINIPIIKFSVNFWNTLHQPASIIRKGGIAIDNAMLLPLLFMFIGSIGFSIIICILRTKTLLNLYKINRHVKQFKQPD